MMSRDRDDYPRSGVTRDRRMAFQRGDDGLADRADQVKRFPVVLSVSGEDLGLERLGLVTGFAPRVRPRQERGRRLSH
jgi:hypothetical protein